MTQADPRLLPPLSSEPVLKAELERVAMLISELRNFAVARFIKLTELEPKDLQQGDELALAVSLAQFRWGLELLSSIERQVLEGWTGPAMITCRSLFELVLSIRYLLGEPSQSVRRSRAYLYCELRKRKAFLRERLIDTDERRALERLAKSDRFGEPLLATLPEARVTQDLEAVERDLASKELGECAQEIDKLRKAGRKNPAWYELFGGPRSIEGLAGYTGYPLCYQVLYRMWSSATHSTQSLSSAIRTRTGITEIRRLRAPTDIFESKVYAFLLGSELVQLMGQWLSAESAQDYAAFYSTVRAEFLRRVSIHEAPG